MKFAILLVALGALCFTGCAGMGVPMAGSIYSDISYPSYYEGAADLGPGAKKGTALAENYVGWVGIGDASVEKACKSAGITKIHTVDHHYWTILGIYSKWTTIVTGD